MKIFASVVLAVVLTLTASRPSPAADERDAQAQAQAALALALAQPTASPSAQPQAPHLPTPPYPNCQCGCTETGKCICKDCDHPCLVAASAPMQKATRAATSVNGVRFTWKESAGMYCPDGPGWQFDADSGLWQRGQAAQPSYQSFTPQFTSFAGQPVQFGDGGGACAGGSCANGQCSPAAGRGGLFGRRR